MQRITIPISGYSQDVLQFSQACMEQCSKEHPRSTALQPCLVCMRCCFLCSFECVAGPSHPRWFRKSSGPPKVAQEGPRNARGRPAEDPRVSNGARESIWWAKLAHQIGGILQKTRDVSAQITLCVHICAENFLENEGRLS